jgi:hypothetical protein
MEHELSAAAVLLVCATVAAPVPAMAVTPPPGGWGPIGGVTAGASLSWVGGGDLGDAFGPGLELTYAHKLNTPLFFWVSGGVKLWTGQGEAGVIPYVETGLSFLILVVGAGYGPGLASDLAPAHGVNAFVGLAVPVWTPSKGHLLYLEPYYRPIWDVSPGGAPVSHEVGLMIKWFFMTAAS